MFKKHLLALDHPQADAGVNANDKKAFRSTILWLEDQKIRHYKIEDRVPLRKIDSNDWQKFYEKYKKDISCPIKSGEPVEELQWILSFAVRLEYSDNKEKYQKASEKDWNSANVPQVVTDNPLDNFDFHSDEFKEGIESLAKILKIQCHPNHLITLKAVSEVVCKRLNPNVLANPSSIIVKGTAFPFQETDLGFDLKDPVLNQAAKVLRLLYIQDLRQLQTKINELIVNVQTVTANPKTDTKLGKVGR